MKYLLVMFFAIMLTVSCSKDELGEIYEPNEIEGNWKMTITARDRNGETYTAFTQTYTFNHDLSGNVLGIASSRTP